MGIRREWLADVLREETVGGILLLGAAAAAVAFANSPWGATYAAIVNYSVGPERLHLHLSLSSWAGDALLAVFFFVAGLELKYELVRGSLRKAATAIVPAAAAVGGMLVPAAIFVAINVGMTDGQPSAWGIPIATDIAFALAVLAIGGRALPLPLRAFLLTLAIVDDLGAILVIAVFYTDSINPLALAGAILVLAAYALAQRRRLASAAIYLPLALAAWMLVHAAGVHATVAGIALGLLTRVKLDPGETESPAERMRHRLHPWSAGVCVPVFAFLAAGVTLTNLDLTTLIHAPIALGVFFGLVVGKPLGIVGSTWLVTRLTGARLKLPMRMGDVWAIGVVAGIGFTVSLLIAQLTFVADSADLAAAKVAVLIASVVAATLAMLVLAQRSRHHGPRDRSP